jgi:hypothetical protein
VSGRHSGPDPVMIALGTAWTALGGALLALLAVTAREPYPCTPAALPGPAPMSVPDQPPPDSP